LFAPGLISLQEWMVANNAVELQTGQLTSALDRLMRVLEDPRPVFQAIAGALEAETERNFEAQGRPSWVPLSAATIAARKKSNTGKSVLLILQDHGNLASSLSTDYGDDFALVGAGGAASAYAAVHQFGADIRHPPRQTEVRLRTDSKGNLLRQRKEGSARNLAVFAKQGSTAAGVAPSAARDQVRSSWHEVGEYAVHIPARPYLPFAGPANAAVLQPEAEASVMEIVQRALLDPFEFSS